MNNLGLPKFAARIVMAGLVALLIATPLIPSSSRAAGQRVNLSFAGADCTGGSCGVHTGAQAIGNNWSINCQALLTNWGTETARDIQVAVNESTDSGVRAMSFVTVSGGSLSGSSWSIPSLSPGSFVSISIRGTIPEQQHYRFNANIGSSNPLNENYYSGNLEFSCTTPNDSSVSGGGEQGGETPPPPTSGGDFTIDCSPVTASIAQGSSAAYEVVVNRTNFYNPITLTASNVPATATYSISPDNTFLAGFSDSRIISISNTQNVAPSTYTLRFSASAAGVQKTSDCNLVVRTNTHNLTGQVNGSGSIAASPAGNPAIINCSSSCSSSYSDGQQVTITPTPDSTTVFSGWGGACSGIGSCVVTMSSDVLVTANFQAAGCSGSSCPPPGGNPPGGNPPGGSGPGGSGGNPPGSNPPTGGSTGGGNSSGPGSTTTGLPTPNNVTADNKTCEKILVSWQTPAGSVDGFNVYRSTNGSSWDKITSRPLGAITTSYLDSSASSGSSYFYAVTATFGSQESAKANSVISPINVRPCAPNLTSSDKDVMAVNGQANIISGHLPIPCSNASDPIKVVDKFREGEVVRFAINICNTGVRDAEDLTFVDQLTNLVEPDTGWRATYNGVAITPRVSGSIPNQVLTFDNLGTIPAPVAPETVEFRVIVFEAKVVSPRPGTVGEYRFQNQGNILMGGNPAKHVQTPSYIFSGGPTIPKRSEQQP